MNPRIHTHTHTHTHTRIRKRIIEDSRQTISFCMITDENFVGAKVTECVRAVRRRVQQTCPRAQMQCRFMRTKAEVVVVLLLTSLLDKSRGCQPVQLDTASSPSRRESGPLGTTVSDKEPRSAGDVHIHLFLGRANSLAKSWLI